MIIIIIIIIIIKTIIIIKIVIINGFLSKSWIPCKKVEEQECISENLIPIQNANTVVKLKNGKNINWFFFINMHEVGFMNFIQLTCLPSAK